MYDMSDNRNLCGLYPAIYEGKSKFENIVFDYLLLSPLHQEEN
jgi:hypothetical protein